MYKEDLSFISERVQSRGRFYAGTPYNGSELEYFPSKDSIHYLKWYGGSHTSFHSDNYYGKKIN